jgi:Protein of unknown function (DUF3570)
MPSKQASRLSPFIVAGLMSMLQLRNLKAENSLDYQYAKYVDFGGRIGVSTQSALINQDLGTDMHLKLGGVVDTIAGATPTGVPAPQGSSQVDLAVMHDRRHAWNSDFSRQFTDFNIDVGISRSIEHDYQSNGWSVNTLWDFNQKNTTILLGTSGSDDDVEVFYKPAWVRKVSNDVIAGITQLIDPQTSITANLTWSRETGFLSDQYKVVQLDIQYLPGIFVPIEYVENRPNNKSKGNLYVSFHHAFLQLNGATEINYRLYHDTFNITAHTLETAWFQKLGSKFILKPSFRYYNQTKATFYHYQLDGLGINPTKTPNPLGPFYSSDARLSAFEAFDFGLKVVYNLSEHIQLYGSADSYKQHGNDGVTPQSAYYRARILTIGSKITW